MNNVQLSQKVWSYLEGSVDKAAKYEDMVAVSFSLISESNEDIFVVVRDGVLRVEPYFYNDCNCVIEASAEIVDKLFSGAISFDKALADGTAKVQRGDVAKFKALECLVPEKKTVKPAAKTSKTASKTAAKEPAKAADKEPAKTAAAPAAKPAAAPAAKPAAAPAAKPATAPASAAKTSSSKTNKKKKK